MTNKNKYFKHQLFYNYPSRPENDVVFICKDSYNNFIGVCKYKLTPEGKERYLFYDADNKLLFEGPTSFEIECKLLAFDIPLMKKAYERRIESNRRKEVDNVINQQHSNENEKNR